MNKFLRAYRACKNIDIACQKARVKKQTIQRWFKKYEDFYTDFLIVDYTEFAEVESVLMKAIKEKEDLKAVFFYLERKGAKFGYGKPQEAKKEQEKEKETETIQAIYVEKN